MWLATPHMEKQTEITKTYIYLKLNSYNNNNNLMIDATREIQELEQGNTYKYLGIEEKDGIQHQQMKERLQQEYRRRLRMILKWEPNAKNKITAIVALAVPVLWYSLV